MLNDVSIVVTAGFRPGYLDDTLNNLLRYFPECTVVVTKDDGTHLHYAHEQRVIWKELPRDSFLTVKRNAAVDLVGTKYTLMASDDFKFTVDTRAVVIRMLQIMADPYINADVVAGTFNGKQYEGYLEVKEGEYIREHRLTSDNAKRIVAKMFQVDIAVNWFLAKTQVLRDVPWDEKIGPIGGEHADWFLDLKAHAKRVVWTPGLDIGSQQRDRRLEDPNYDTMRGRCWDGHALFLAKRGVKRYIGFGEQP